MPIRSHTARFIIYTLLVGASVLFVIPFVWLLATSVKPLEQTMTIPPTWIPKAYFTQFEGRRVEVTLDFKQAQSGAVVTLLSGEHVGEKAFLSDSQLAST
ncbi:MAG TPA: hypothetical protein VIM69_07945, partial [Opitutaceae bacterium]